MNSQFQHTPSSQAMHRENIGQVSNLHLLNSTTRVQSTTTISEFSLTWGRYRQFGYRLGNDGFNNSNCRCKQWQRSVISASLGAVATAITTMSDFSLTPGSSGMTGDNGKWIQPHLGQQQQWQWQQANFALLGAATSSIQRLWVQATATVNQISLPPSWGTFLGRFIGCAAFFCTSTSDLCTSSDQQLGSEHASSTTWWSSKSWWPWFGGAPSTWVLVTTHQAGQDPFVLEYDGDNEGRVQMDNEYKLTILLIYLVRTIKMFHIRNHMHHAGSHEFPIPTRTAVLFFLLVFSWTIGYFYPQDLNWQTSQA